MIGENSLKVFAGKRICIWGLGNEGKSSLRFLTKFFPSQEISVLDKNAEMAEKFVKDSNANSRVFAQNEIAKSGLETFLKKFDLVLKTPGISFTSSDKELSQKISSQTIFFLRFFANRSIGITGTKGKSTTASLTHKILLTAKVKAHLLGNIGKPIFDIFCEEGADFFKANNSRNKNSQNGEVFVLELSSFQLEGVRQSPHIAVVLNLYEDHTDYHFNKKNYWQAKSNIFRFQKPSDFLVLSSQADEVIKSELSGKEILSKIVLQEKATTEFGKQIFANFVNANKSGNNFLQGNALAGEHNRSNFLMATQAVKIFLGERGLSLHEEVITQVLRNFKSLPHRLELVREFDNVTFVNDSISTIPEATMAALQALPETNILILGGYDRGINYKKFAENICGNWRGNLRLIICLGNAGKRIYDEIGLIAAKQISREGSESIKTLQAENLTNAVRVAKDFTKSELGGEKSLCLFSPAAPSFDAFANFEERGDNFKKAVRSHVGK